FGFGFYWKVLESRAQSSRSAESAISQVQGALAGASTRLTNLQSTLDNLTAVSQRKALEERERGTSCPNSRPGDGPRRRLRDADAARFGFASDFVKRRVGNVKGEVVKLNADMQKVVRLDRTTIDKATGTRNDFMRGLNRKLNITVAGFNAFRTDPQLRQIRADLADRAARTSFPNGRGGTFSCPDAQLQTALRGVVRAIDQLPELEKPQIAAVEGSEAVVEAFRRLTATVVGAMSFKLPPTPEEVRARQEEAMRSLGARAKASALPQDQAGLSNRDYIPLSIAIFVDLCLLLVSIGRPMNRLQNLIPKMREAERGPVTQILSRFNEIHQDDRMRQSFDLLRHVVFDLGSQYYVAVPLDAPKRMNPEEREKLLTEAQLLKNLFSSFENEKIFTRVVVPLVSNKGIGKRLAKQGSKFAQAEAFRVYKFRDGAYSEIILGAVMGAARRAEQRKREMALAQALTAPDAASTGATLRAADDGTMQTTAAPVSHEVPHEVTARDENGTMRSHSGPAAREADPHTLPRPTAYAKPAGGDGFAMGRSLGPMGGEATEPDPVASTPAAGLNGHAPVDREPVAPAARFDAALAVDRQTDEPTTAQPSTGQPDAVTLAKFGPYSHHVARANRAVGEDAPRLQAANRNTAPSRARVEASDDMEHQTGAPQEPQTTQAAPAKRNVIAMRERKPEAVAAPLNPAADEAALAQGANQGAGQVVANMDSAPVAAPASATAVATAAAPAAPQQDLVAAAAAVASPATAAARRTPPPLPTHAEHVSIEVRERTLTYTGAAPAAVAPDVTAHQAQPKVIDIEAEDLAPPPARTFNRPARSTPLVQPDTQRPIRRSLAARLDEEAQKKFRDEAAVEIQIDEISQRFAAQAKDR
ncbi:MAG: hypothetical protein AAFR04_15715, partial [Pseudomonadota bacterium]